MYPTDDTEQVRNDARPAVPSGNRVLRGLNEEQRRAVTHPGGPLLVLAGAGSGKTRVITHRVAHLVLERGVAPERILAVTFTNKAAAEMRERVGRLLGVQGFGCWIGTFHSLCLRILRRDGSLVGLEPGFNIYDTDDQLALVRRLLKDADCGSDAGSPRAVLSRISRAKNALMSADEMEKTSYSPAGKLVAQMYRKYDEALRQANAVDFDDLLLRTLDLFDGRDEVAAGYAERCERLLVDEYQDTNRPQYRLIRHLSAHHRNVCVVGDEDQSIYRFRGAELRNILDFERDHSGSTTIRLEQNYRSSGTIIGAASALIANNLLRKGKTLWTANPPGEPIELFRAPEDRVEAGWIARRVRELESRRPYEEMAVLYRTNAQSRLLEEAFRRDRVPYQVVGSVQFYERKEVKDLLAYLKLAANPLDDVAFRRVLNTPPRGIGNTTLRVVEDVARGMGMPLIRAAVRALDDDLLAKRPAAMMRGFLEFVADLAKKAADEPVAALLDRLIDELGFEAYLARAYGAEVADRMDNLRSLVSAAAEYADETDNPTLRGFLDRSALVSDADEVGSRPGVTLMTVHCAKGLEYPVVFLAGLEENLFPHAMASGTDEDLEEERRLCYVAMTRAKELLILSQAAHRRFQGALLPNLPSRFLDEIPRESIREAMPAPGDWFGGWETRDGASGGRSSGSSAARAVARRAAPATTAPKVRKKAGQAADPGDGFAVGADVVHPRFGGGRILDREGQGKHLKLTIHFMEHGQKKIAPAYTKLRVRVS